MQLLCVCMCVHKPLSWRGSENLSGHMYSCACFVGKLSGIIIIATSKAEVCAERSDLIGLCGRSMVRPPDPLGFKIWNVPWNEALPMTDC